MPDPILIVDDDVELCRLLEEYLGREGFLVESVHDGRNGLQRARSGAHSLIVLDIMLPEMRGLDVLQQLRVDSEVPVLMLSARGEDVDRIYGLELGADDYLAKPFNPRELAARIRAVQRRTASESDALTLSTSTPLVVGNIRLDPKRKTVICDGSPLALTEIEFNLLEQLLRTPGTDLTRENLSRSVLGRPYHSSDRSLDVHVSGLRRKLGRRPNGKERIFSVRGVGYVYIEE